MLHGLGILGQSSRVDTNTGTTNEVWDAASYIAGSQNTRKEERDVRSDVFLQSHILYIQ